MKPSALGSFVISFGVTATILVGATSNAAWRRASSLPCAIDHDMWQTLQGIANPTAFYGGVYCAVDDTDSLPKANLMTVNIHGYDASDTAGVSAELCVTYWSSNGGACGTSASTGVPNIGDYVLQPSRSMWNSAHAGDFGWIGVVLPPYDSQTGQSSFRGYFTST